MRRYALFLLPLFLLPLFLLAAGSGLVEQHQKGLGFLPQQQAISQLAAGAHRLVCR